MKRYQVIILFIIILVALGIAGEMDFEDEQLAQDNYCEMVKLYKQTNGQQGWPAYNGEAACK